MTSAQTPEEPTAEPARRLPPATVSRLTLYLRTLNALLTEGTESVSSEALAESAGVGSANVRKDLSYLGSYGTRGVGYDVANLSRKIAQALGLTHEWRVAIVGAGNLGRALARYAGFESRGFDVVALLDADQMIIGNEIGWLRVSDVANLENVVKSARVNMVVLALPAAVAQSVCDRVVAAGVRSILSFAPVALTVPEHVNLRKVDMATELQILAYHAQRLQEPRLEPDSPERARLEPTAWNRTGPAPESDARGRRRQLGQPVPAAPTSQCPAPGGYWAAVRACRSAFLGAASCFVRQEELLGWGPEQHEHGNQSQNYAGAGVKRIRSAFRHQRNRDDGKDEGRDSGPVSPAAQLGSNPKVPEDTDGLNHRHERCHRGEQLLFGDGGSSFRIGVHGLSDC